MKSNKQQTTIVSNNSSKRPAKGIGKIMSYGWVSQKDILFFTKNLAVMLRSGSTLSEALVVIKEETKGRMRVILTDVCEQVNKGYKFSEALRKYPNVFSEMYANVLQIGEESGRLEQNLEHLVSQLERNYALRKKITGAMVYPAVVLIGSIILSLGIVVFVLPKVVTLFKNFKVALPFTTRVMIAVSDFFQIFGIWSVVAILAFLVFVYWISRRNFVKPVTHWLILKMPIVGTISKHMNAAVFFQTLNTLLNGGITIDDGLKICTKIVPNIYYKKFFLYAYEKVRAGGALTAVLKERKDLFPATDAQIVNVGEESGTLNESLNYCFSIHDGEIDDITKNLATILEPLLLIMIGFMVGFLALAIITPIYSITGQIYK